MHWVAAVPAVAYHQRQPGVEHLHLSHPGTWAKGKSLVRNYCLSFCTCPTTSNFQSAVTMWPNAFFSPSKQMKIVRFSYACQANWGWVMWLVSLARTSWRHVILRTTVSRIDVLGLAYTVLPRIMLPVPRPYVQNCGKMHVLVSLSILRPRDLLTNHYFPIYNAELNTGQSYMDASLDLALDTKCLHEWHVAGRKKNCCCFSETLANVVRNLL